MNTPTPSEVASERKKYKLLFPEDRPVVAPESLIMAVGLERALIMQQLHFLLRNKKNGKVLPNRKGRWIYNTYPQWKEQYFPWMSLMSIRRHFRALEVMGAVESCQPEGRRSRRKYYRLSDAVVKMTADTLRSIRAENKRILHQWEAARVNAS